MLMNELKIVKIRIYVFFYQILIRLYSSPGNDKKTTKKQSRHFVETYYYYYYYYY